MENRRDPLVVKGPPAMTHATHSSNLRVALSATIHCLTGCSIGEVLGMVIGGALRWSNAATVVLAVVLAFFFGYAFTLRPLVSAGMAIRNALSLAFAADTISITIMEIVDNLIMLALPGAMDAPITSLYFWSSLAFALLVAGAAAFPVNVWLIRRGRGHAHVHAHHGGHQSG
jgi:hypothetical protein